MSLDTYSNLKAEIASYLDRSDLTSKIDTFIDLAEERHHTELRIRGMLKRATAPCSTTVRYLALPTGYLHMRILRLMSTPVTRLQFVNEDEMTRQIQSASGKPVWYTIHEEIEFDRVCDSAYSAEMIYYAKPTPLSLTSQTNTVLTNHPSLYLYGALLEAEPFLDNDERIPVWKAGYDLALASANMSDRKSRHVGTLVQRPVIGRRY